MTISRGEFESGKLAESLASKIENFLKQNNDRAFTLREICQNIDHQGGEESKVSDTSTDTMMELIALSYLSKTNVIDARSIDHNGKEDVYYIATTTKDR